MTKPCWSSVPEKSWLLCRARATDSRRCSAGIARWPRVPRSPSVKYAVGLPRRTWYYRSVKAVPKVQQHLVSSIKVMIDENPSLSYRTVAALLGFNKNTVQRIFQLKGWQVRNRPVGFRPRLRALSSVASAPNQRWATDLCRIWAGQNGWYSLALVIDCHTRELLGGIYRAVVNQRRLRRRRSKR